MDKKIAFLSKTRTFLSDLQLLKWCIYSGVYTKVCGHPFKLVDLAISATPAADRCIKWSTQPCNLHRLAVEWPY